MTETNHLDLMLNALTEIMQEEKAKQIAPLSSPTPTLPDLNSILARIALLPPEALFLGMDKGIETLIAQCDARHGRDVSCLAAD